MNSRSWSAHDTALRAASPVDDAQLVEHLDQHLREDLLARLQADQPGSADRAGTARVRTARRRRRPVLVAGLVAGLLATGVGAYAARDLWVEKHPAQQLKAGCLQDQDGGSSVPFFGTDPVADCAAAWEQQFGEPAPPMTVWTGPNGVVVQPTDWPALKGMKPLKKDFGFDPALMYLEHSLQDAVRGYPGSCLSTEAGRALAEELLGKSGLQGWRIVDEGVADGKTSCVRILPEAQTKTVRNSAGDDTAGLMGDEPGGDLLPYQRMVQRLRQDLDGGAGCLDRDAALVVVRRAGAAAGLKEKVTGYQIAEPDRDGPQLGDCVRVVVIVGGSVRVELWHEPE